MELTAKRSPHTLINRYDGVLADAKESRKSDPPKQRPVAFKGRNREFYRWGPKRISIFNKRPPNSSPSHQPTADLTARLPIRHSTLSKGARTPNTIFQRSPFSVNFSLLGFLSSTRLFLFTALTRPDLSPARTTLTSRFRISSPRGSLIRRIAQRIAVLQGSEGFGDVSPLGRSSLSIP